MNLSPRLLAITVLALFGPALGLAIGLGIANAQNSPPTLPAAAIQPVPPTVTQERLVPVVIMPAPTSSVPATQRPVQRQERKPTARRAPSTPVPTPRAGERKVRAEDGSLVPESFYRHKVTREKSKTTSATPTTTRGVPTTSSAPPTSSATPTTSSSATAAPDLPQ
jgi:hypothetical protein